MTAARRATDPRTRARIARRYFVDRATKIEIGAEFGLTRFQVAKLVQDCLDDGTVTITIRGPEHVDGDRSDRLARRWGLVDALVVDDLAAAGPFVAGMLAGRLADGDVLAVGWTPDVERVLDPAAGGLPRCEVVQARGVSGLDDHGIELVKRVAGACGGEPYPIYAPFLAGTVEDAATLRAHPLVGVATARFGRVAAAVLGAVGPGGSGWPDAVDGEQTAGEPGVGEARPAAALGPVLLDAAGAPAGPADRTIGLDAGQLARVPFVLAVGAGPTAALALRLALASGLVHAVVTDREAAARLD